MLPIHTIKGSKKASSATAPLHLKWVIRCYLYYALGFFFRVDIINLLKEIKSTFISFVGAPSFASNRFCSVLLFFFRCCCSSLSPIILLLFTWVLSADRMQWICVPATFCAFCLPVCTLSCALSRPKISSNQLWLYCHYCSFCVCSVVAHASFIFYIFAFDAIKF